MSASPEAKRAYRERMKNDPEWLERQRQHSRNYYAANRERVLARMKANYEAAPDAKRARARQESDDLRRQMLDAYGRSCACCGESEERFLCLDHVGGGGSQDRKATSGNNTGVLRRLRREGWPRDGYRVLCHNCNAATAWGTCPHQTRG